MGMTPSVPGGFRRDGPPRTAASNACHMEGYATVDTNWQVNRERNPLIGTTSAGTAAVLADPTTSVLIVKLGWTETLAPDSGTTCSLGDVLRTTPILHVFRGGRVTWLTDARAAALLPGKPYIDELLTYGPETYAQLAGREFSHVVNLECDARLTEILQALRYDKWSGFPIWQTQVLGRHDVDGDYREGLLAGAQKGRTWPEILFEMIGATYADEPMILGGVRQTTITHDIGLNYKVGPKWPTKAWPEECWQALGRELGKTYTLDFQRHLNDLEGYIAWVNSCRLLITSDSLGMHIAQALGKKMIALFGPTSSDMVPATPGTIFLHAQPRPACQPCYRPECERDLACLRAIQVADVAAAAERLLNEPPPPGRG